MVANLAKKHLLLFNLIKIDLKLTKSSKITFYHTLLKKAHRLYFLAQFLDFRCKETNWLLFYIKILMICTLVNYIQIFSL